MFKLNQQQVGPSSETVTAALVIAFLIASSRCVLKLFPENGTQKNIELKINPRGQQAGNRPLEKDRASAIVSER